MPQNPPEILKNARARAGLTQRALAERAGTAQSVVARIENGQTSPTWDTLERLLAAAGHVIRAVAVGSYKAVPGESDIPRVLALDPAARLQEGRNADRFVSAARRVS